MVLTISPLSWAVETYLVDGFTEPRVLIPDLDTPEERMTLEVQAAIEQEKNQPIRDAQGRIHYIVDLVDEVDQGYSDKTPLDESLGAWNKPTMFGVVRAFETQYKLKATGLFSWVGKGFTAYLTPQQFQALQQNPLVAQISEDHLTEFSVSLVGKSSPVIEIEDHNPLLAAERSLTTECSPSAECFPWNIGAVGGGKPSNGSVPIFVLDAGVGYHVDLPNVVTRTWAKSKIGRFSVGTVPVVGCYPHATHVAGILSAPRNDLGTVGVYSSAPVTSIAATSTPEATSDCATKLGAASDIGFGLNRIKYEFLTRKGGPPLGVVNISINSSEKGKTFEENTFASTTSTGKKLKSLAQPSWKYSGAFIAQSAGNLKLDACNYAYALPSKNASDNDGIMVVGATDINGQPVVPLNNIIIGGTRLGGFRNQELLGTVNGVPNTQPGSNEGLCVDIWAPGNGIYSTWAPRPQSGDKDSPSEIYAYLSGTSMAAPHVAGVAAWLSESGKLTTPAQIEAAVRSHAYFNGAKDQTGLPILLAHTNGINGSTAKPTVEFAIGIQVNGHLDTDSASPFTLSYDSIGAIACDLTARKDGLISYQWLGYSPKLDWGPAGILLPPAYYEWKVTCISAVGTTSTAQATATVSFPPPKPVASFSYNGQKQDNPATNSFDWPIDLTAIKEIPYQTAFDLSYSTNTETCQLSRYKASFPYGPWQEWEPPTVMPTYYPFTSILLEKGFYYWWTLNCTGAGGSVTANFFAHSY